MTRSEQRADLMLQLAILAKQRSAKLLELVDALRRDLPEVAHEPDPATAALSEPADPSGVLQVSR